ncbi:hypothetical protein MTO96_014521 [Rhipicephalus appendiculatus]
MTRNVSRNQANCPATETGSPTTTAETSFLGGIYEQQHPNNARTLVDMTQMSGLYAAKDGRRDWQASLMPSRVKPHENRDSSGTGCQQGRRAVGEGEKGEEKDPRSIRGHRLATT